MPFFDLPLDERRGYSPDLAEPADFDEFWQASLADAGSPQMPATWPNSPISQI